MRKPNLHRIFALLLTLLSAAPLFAASIEDGGEYYIISDYYNMVLGVDSTSSSTPALSAFGTNVVGETYVMVAEASGEDGYFYLKNKSTGRYLAASTSNTWSLVWQDAKGSGSEYLWKLDVQMGKAIVSKKNTSTRLGSDWSEDDYVRVYYDKARNSMTRFSVIPALEAGYEASLLAAETDVFTSEIGRQEIDVYRVTEQVELTDTVDFHIVSDYPIDSLNGGVTVSNRAAWVIFENQTPSEVIDNWLQYIKIGSAQAVNGTNVRVAIYLDGAAVIPCRPSESVFFGYTETDFGGDELRLKKSNYTTLNKWNNRLRSFVLKRGFMAVVGSGQGSTGYTRVYVADHADLVVSDLPDALDERISSIWIKPWQYTSKKGWCSTQGTSGIFTGMGKMNATWYYTWSADRYTSDNYEYVPMQTHKYWPSVSTITEKTGSTAMLGLNEPEHSEQHEDCSCGGTISAWTACTLTPNYASTGMRVGSPGPTDTSYLTEYITNVDNMAYRCDFVALHCYWGSNEADGASAWYNQLYSVYQNTKRPIWITEWAYGASWTTETWPSNYSEQLELNRKKVMEIVDMLERQPWIEHYSYYQWDTSSRRMINDDGWVTPAGRVYRDTKSTFGYNANYQKVPNWWTPSTKQTGLTYEISEDGQTVTFKIANTNGDLTSLMALQKYDEESGEWTTLYEVADRYLLDNDTIAYEVPMSDIDRWTDRFRVFSDTQSGGDATSATIDLGYIRNADCNDGTNNWTVSNLGTNSGEAYDSESTNTYWDKWNGSGLSSSMSQTITDLPAGRYVLNALLRGSSNATITLTISVTHDGETTTYTETIQGVGSTTIDGADYDNGWMEVSLPQVEVFEGDEVTITATGSGTGSTWWSADHFTFTYDVPTAIEGISAESGTTGADAAGKIYTLDGKTVAAPTQGGIYIKDGKKILITK